MEGSFTGLISAIKVNGFNHEVCYRLIAPVQGIFKWSKADPARPMVARNFLLFILSFSTPNASLGRQKSAALKTNNLKFENKAPFI
jgi:hypothetical protein